MANELCHPADAVVDIDGRRGFERDEAPVGRDRRLAAFACELRPVGTTADPLGGLRDTVTNEHVGDAIRVPYGEVRGFGPHDDEATVRAHPREARLGIRLCAVRADAYPLGR